MSYIMHHLLIIWFFVLSIGNLYCAVGNTDTDDLIPRRINHIMISSTDPDKPLSIPITAIENKIPYKEHDIFKASKSNQLIKTLFNLGYFRNIKVTTENVGTDLINITIIVEEKNKVENIVYNGNAHLTADEVEKKIHISDIKSIDPEELPSLEEQLKKLYIEKSYHNAEITAQLIPTADNRVNIEFTINEGQKSLVKRVFFKGNKCIPSRKLRTLIFTREDWIIGFFDKAGSYQPEAVEYDRHVIENFYQSNGFLTARVTDVTVERDACDQFIVTFFIEEGDIYTVSSVKIEGNEILSSEQIFSRVPIRPGQLYSREIIRNTMESLRLLWGEFGYIYADVQPSIKPNEATKTVDLEFISDLGSKVIVNRINLVGNKKTRDKVIRRELLLNEGEMLPHLAWKNQNDA